MEASKPEDTETEGAEAQMDFGPWTARKRFRAEYVSRKFLFYCYLNNFIMILVQLKKEKGVYDKYFCTGTLTWKRRSRHYHL